MEGSGCGRGRKEMKGIRGPIRMVLIVFFLGVALASVLHIVQWAEESYRSNQTQKELQQLYHQGSLLGKQEEPVPGQSGSQLNQEPGIGESYSGESSSGGADSEASENPSADEQTVQLPEMQMLPEYRVLYEKNKDIVGWLNIGGGMLSTPIMQRSGDYYLNHDFYGNEDKHGQVFLDERNHNDLSDDNTILYGHNITRDNSMFNILTKYKDPEFVANYPTIQVNTLYRKYQYAVTAVYLTSTRPEDGELFDYINYLRFSTRTAKEAYLAQINRRSLIDTGGSMNADDRILTFSTCSYEFTGARLVVVARRLRDGENPEDFGQKVTKRENPLMPEIWTKLFG